MEAHKAVNRSIDGLIHLSGESIRLLREIDSIQERGPYAQGDKKSVDMMRVLMYHMKTGGGVDRYMPH